MFTSLRRYAYVPIAAFALWVALLAVSPATATAKETPHANDPQITNHDAGAAERVVVAPGDSLWSISAQWLGPEASTRQIANGVERIYTRNQTQIGSDPNLIFAGQKLLLPSRVEQRRSEPRRAAPAQHTGQPTKSSPPLRAANNGSDTPARAAVGKVNHEARQLPHGQSEAVSLPEPVRAAPVGAVRSLTPNGPSPLAQPVTSGARSIFSFVSASVATVSEALLRGPYSGRRLLGGTILAMSALLGLILALYVGRQVRKSMRLRRRSVQTTHFATYERPPRDHAKATSGGLRPRQRGRRPVNPGQSARNPRNPRRRGGRILGTEPTKPNPMQEWKISEPLRRAIESIPVTPGVPARSTLLEVEHLAADALSTFAPLERHRRLTDMEQRQARALQKLVASIEEAYGDDKMR